MLSSCAKIVARGLWARCGHEFPQLAMAFSSSSLELQTLNAIPEDIEKYMWLRQLQETNPTAYFR